MVGLKTLAKILVAGAAITGLTLAAAADELRNVKKGEPLPAFRLPTTDGKFVASTGNEGNVVVLVYLSAEQTSSEQAMVESEQVVEKFGDSPVRLIHVTADVVHKPYFDKLRDQSDVDAPLALDASRSLYGDLGLIVFPTTIIATPDGKLAHVISTRGAEYARTLEAYIRHTLGQIDEGQLEQRLTARPSEMGSPKSLASRHRAAARLLREKGLIDDARQELVKAMEFDPQDANIRLDLADIDLSTGQHAEARELAVGVLSEQPEHRRAKQLAGIAAFKLGDVEEADRLLTESLVLNPDPARALYFLGRIAEMRGDTTAALKRYRDSAEHLLGE